MRKSGKTKYKRMIAAFMFLAADGLVAFAFNHPEMSWPWSNAVSHILYGTYLIVTVVLFIAPVNRK